MSKQRELRVVLDELQRVYGVPAHLREVIASAARVPMVLLSSAALADNAELTALRSMREALVRLRNRAAIVDTEVARDIDEVLAVSPLCERCGAAVNGHRADDCRPVAPPIESPEGLSRAREAFRSAPPPRPSTELVDHRARTIEALLTAIDRELAGAAQPIERVSTLAHAVAVLAGAPL